MQNERGDTLSSDTRQDCWDWELRRQSAHLFIANEMIRVIND